MSDQPIKLTMTPEAQAMLERQKRWGAQPPVRFSDLLKALDEGKMPEFEKEYEAIFGPATPKP